MMNTFIGFCYGPLLYLYTRKVIDASFIPVSKWYIFIPFIAGMIGYFSVISVLVASPDAGHEMLYWYNTLTFWALIPLGFTFSYIAIRKAVNYLPAEKRERKLIIQLAAILMLLSVVALVSSLLQYNGYQLNVISRGIAYSLLVLICLRIINYRYAELNPNSSAEVFKPMMLEPPAYDLREKKEGVPPDHQEEVKRSTLNEKDMKRIWLKLEDCMSQQVVFADCDLNLDKLASLSKLSKYHISETLNQYAGKSFYHYINEYRTNHVVNKLNDLHSKDIQVNMLNLAFDAGFKSKSSFNRYFKELTGQTPSEYFRSLTKMEAQTI